MDSETTESPGKPNLQQKSSVQAKCPGWGKKKVFVTSDPKSCNCLSSPVPSVKGNGCGLVGPNQKQLVWWMGASLSPYFSRNVGFPDSQSCFKQGWPRTSPGGLVVKTSPSNAGGAASICGWEAKIPHASCSKKLNTKQKQYCNKFNKDFGPHQEIFKKKKIHLKRTKEQGWPAGDHLQGLSLFYNVDERMEWGDYVKATV